MTEQQPMKMAAAEALWNSAGPASFSIFTIGTLSGDADVFSVRIPDLLSLLGTGTLDGEVEGINNLQAEYEQKFGPGDYKPNIAVTYWSFRLMIGFGTLAALVALVALWFTRGGRTPRNRWLWLSAVVAIGLPLAANSFGWIFTEMGRQPWTVFGVFKTAESVSPSVSTAEAATSLIVLTVLYGILAVVEVGLFIKYARAGAPEIPPDTGDESQDRPLAFAY
jgi:cytochrome d ubiquinol oxidase subunit I